jgi:ubiquinone/menaquinone biosynthesis C-methylase UbiE
VKDILKKGDKVLEIGVGLGYVTQGFKENGINVSALDISQVALNRVRDYCEKLYIVDKISELPDNCFDVIICQNGIQHIPTYLLEIELPHLIRSLKPTGVFAMEFVSSQIAEDTGKDFNSDIKWDESIGCYCRTPAFLEKLINNFGGNCKLVYDYHGDIEPYIKGCHIFHITKR